VNRTSSSSRPAWGSTAHPRPKKTRGRTTAGHQGSLNRGNARMAEISRWVVPRRRRKITGRKVISIHEEGSHAWSKSFLARGINIRRRKADMTQMLAVSAYCRARGTAPGCHGCRKRNLALELLRCCGMILRARLRTSQTDERCHRSLSSCVHHSSVIWCNVLNLSSAWHV
jgi:hypothetical protein